ncbi:hypothetical protein JTB14_007874 [Gonioctena quinquepunctata]|nr:hypothetical protein JTB14_007874 [Gonioctena quinquepunctata]
MFVVFLVLFGLTLGMKLPDGVPLCHKSDPKFKECLGVGMEEGLKLLANGYKPMGVPILEPFFVNEMYINEAAAQQVAVSQRYRNLNIHGMTRSKVKILEVDLDQRCFWKSSVESPQINLIGDYELKGKIMIFPIDSHGRANISLTRLHHNHTMICEKFTKKSQIYMRIVNYTMEMLPDEIHYDFNDIFSTNRQMGNEILKTLNENSLELFKDVKNGFQKAFSIFHSQIGNLVFSKVPMDEIFLP